MFFGTLLTIRKKKFRKISKNFQKTGKIVKTKNDCKEIPCIKTPILRIFGEVLTVFWKFFEIFLNFFFQIVSKVPKNIQTYSQKPSRWRKGVCSTRSGRYLISEWFSPPIKADSLKSTLQYNKWYFWSSLG